MSTISPPLTVEAAAEEIRSIASVLQQWACEGPPQKMRAAFGEIAERLAAASAASGSAAEEAAGLRAQASDAEQSRAQTTQRAEQSESAAADFRAKLAALERLSAEREAMRREEDTATWARLAVLLERNAQLVQENEALKAEADAMRHRERTVAAQVASVLSPVSVMCRVRPLASYAAQEQLGRSALNVDGGEINVEDAAGRTRKFRTDRVLDGSVSQDDVFTAAAPWIENVVLGGSSCLLAYGATGSGKTYTLQGAGELSDGIATNALKRLINLGELKVTMLEVYCDQIRDLLAEQVAGADKAGEPPVLQCSRRDSAGRLILDSTEVTVSSLQEASAALLRGYNNCAREATLCNERSSRSHVVLMVQVAGAPQMEVSAAATGQVVAQGRLVLVDLAGSENVQRSGADEGGKLLAEAKAINKSLSALADVVEATAKRQSFVPFRNSRLTTLLEETLTCAKVLLLVHVSPLSREATNTGHSLQFAGRIRAVDFGAQQLRKDQEERLRAAHQRDQQENRTLMAQLEQVKKDLAAAQSAQQDSKQQASNLAEQLRDRQRELTREQELRSRAEETVREQKYSLSSGSQGAGGSSSSFQAPDVPTATGSGDGMKPTSSRPKSPYPLDRSKLRVPSSSSTSSTAAVVPPTIWKHSRPLESSREDTGDAATRGDCSDLDDSCSAKSDAASAADTPCASPRPATGGTGESGDLPEEESAGPSQVLEQTGHSPSSAAARIFCSPLPGISSPEKAANAVLASPLRFSTALASAEIEKSPLQARSPGRHHVYNGSLVRSILKPQPTDFTALRLLRQTGETPVSCKRHIAFSEDAPVAKSPPKWYLELRSGERPTIGIEEPSPGVLAEQNVEIAAAALAAATAALNKDNKEAAYGRPVLRSRSPDVNKVFIARPYVPKRDTTPRPGRENQEPAELPRWR
eukprot:TRINITY_DN80_c0_g3_i1.p1 TRINITY_DN80_c0_g3~~TRINITY_DN80_c0_g3_i1.p1  ORF type:complete len:927 (-),score=229.76 TRINITY_DN80_c0_g3_i1:120-2900(-)